MTVEEEKMPRVGRAPFWIIGILASLYALGGLLVGIAQAVIYFTTSTNNPVRLYLADTVPTGGDGTATVVKGTYGAVTLVTNGLSSAARTPLGLSALTSGLIAFIVAGSLALLCQMLLQGRSFRRSLMIATLTAGLTLFVGNIVAQAFSAGGGLQAAVELNGTAHTYSTQLAFDAGPVVVGALVLLLAWLFAVGERMDYTPKIKK